MDSKKLIPWLEEKFKLGSEPVITRALYRRLERELERYGKPVLDVILQVAETALSYAEEPGPWFRSGVVKRLKLRGFLQPGERKLDKGTVESCIDDLRNRILKTSVPAQMPVERRERPGVL